MAQQYWLISVPCEPSTLKLPQRSDDQKDAQKKAIQEKKAADLKERQTKAKMLMDHPTEGRGYSNNIRFEGLNLGAKNKFKVGSIDALMSVSDDLVKLDTALCQVVKKIEKTYADVSSLPPPEKVVKDKPVPELGIMYGQTKYNPTQFLRNFRWDKGLYPSNLSLHLLKDKISAECNESDESQRKFTQEYNDIKNALIAMERKEQGSLQIRSLAKFVKQSADPSKSDIIETDRFTTLLVVVPRQRLDEFLLSYESMEEEQQKRQIEEQARHKEQQEKDRQKREAMLKEKGGAAGTDNEVSASEAKSDSKAEPKTKGKADAAAAEKKGKEVPKTTIIPGSAKVLTTEADDKEFALVRIVCFKLSPLPESDLSESKRSMSNIDFIKSICRDRKYTVRPYKYDANEDETTKRQLLALAKKRTERWTHLLNWCDVYYDSMFKAWIHVKAMRTYVESVLRFGLSNDWYCCLIMPKKGYEKTMRDVLADLYKNLANASLTAALDPNEVDMSGFGQDFYPYVYLPIELGTD